MIEINEALTKMTIVSNRCKLNRLMFAMLALAALPCANAAEVRDERFVLAGGMITEVVYALGRQDLVVGVDTTSLAPASALKEKSNVGYLRALSAEGILSLNPTKLITTAHAGPPAVLDSIKESGVSIVYVPEPTSEAEIIANVRSIAREVSKPEEGEAIARQIEKGFEDLALAREKKAAKARVLFVLSSQNGRLTVAGQNTSADFMIRLAGAENAMSGLNGYKLVTNEAIVNAAPDAVLMISRGAEEANKDVMLSHPGIALTPAAANGKVIIMDGLYLLGLGMRTPRAALELHAKVFAK